MAVNEWQRRGNVHARGIMDANNGKRSLRRMVAEAYERADGNPPRSLLRLFSFMAKAWGRMERFDAIALGAVIRRDEKMYRRCMPESRMARIVVLWRVIWGTWDG